MCVSNRRIEKEMVVHKAETKRSRIEMEACPSCSDAYGAQAFLVVQVALQVDRGNVLGLVSVVVVRVVRVMVVVVDVIVS